MNRFRAGLILTVLALAGLATESRAQSAEPFVANRPGATLLLPYFEVDLDNPSGTTTLFAVNNASATAILAHVTVWSDLGIPVLAFNAYLTGYDMQTFDMRDVLNGSVPRTASAGQDFQNTISPQGMLSQDINFASCGGQLPLPTMPASLVGHVRSALTGAPSSYYGGMCAGRNLGTPGVARGYVTVDVVNHCTLAFPGDPFYFGTGGSGTVTNQNVLWGDYQYIDPSRQFATGDTLVSLRASPADPETSTPGNYTFYGRFVGFSAADNREPLSTTFGARFVAAKAYKEENRAVLQQVLPPATELIVWRDPKTVTQPFACGSAPSWYPLGQSSLAAFDEQENPQSLNGVAPFGAATQRVAVASSALPVTPESGWIYMNLNTTVPGQVAGLATPNAAQAWVTVIQRVHQGPTGGRYDVGFRAIRFDSARTPSNIVLPLP